MSERLGLGMRPNGSPAPESDVADRGPGAGTGEPLPPGARVDLARRRARPRFANARSVRDAIERARLRHAGWLLAQGGDVGRDDLTALRPEDFLAGGVFR